MKSRLIWTILGLMLLLAFGTTFMRTLQQIGGLLEEVSVDVKTYSAFVHLLFLTVIILGLIFKDAGRHLFSFFMAFISLSATVMAIKYNIAPNILIFSMFFVLIIHAFIRKKLNFDFRHTKPVQEILPLFTL